MIRLLLLSLLLLQGVAGAEVSFSRDLAPILQSKCVGCHGKEKSKGGYRVDSYALLMKTGTSKDTPVQPGQPEQSGLFQRLVTTDPDDRMPQKDEPLPSAEIGLFRSWIAAGAPFDRGDTNAMIASLIPKPPHPAPPEKYGRPVPVLALAFAPDGKQLAAGGLHEVTFWSLEGALERRLTNVPQRVRSLAFLPVRDLLALAGGQPGRNGELSVYDLKAGTCLTNLVHISDEVLCLALSADGQHLACGATDNAIYVFDTGSWALVTRIQQHADWVTSLAFNTNNALIASASRDRTARIYQAATGSLDATYTGQTVPLNVIAFLPDGTVASGGRDKSLHVWTAVDGKKKAEFTGFSDSLYVLLQTEESIYTATADGTLRQHSIADRKEVRTFTGPGGTIFSLACDAEGAHIAAGHHDGTVTLWNARTGQVEKSFDAAPGWSAQH